MILWRLIDKGRKNLIFHTNNEFDMKIKLLTIFIFVVCVLFSCTVGKNSSKNKQNEREILMQHERNMPKKLSSVSILDRDSMFYFCSSHYSSFKKNIRNKKYKTRKICTCEFAFPASIDILLGVSIRRGILPSCQDILFYDSSFVSEYILPLVKKEEDRKIIEYTLSNANDSTFKNIIDFEQKIIINENAYYYPINSKKMLSVHINDIEWFKSVAPVEKWLYIPSCYNENVVMYLLVPLLDYK